MRAAQINSYGGPEVVKLTTEAPKPRPAKGQVLVQAHASGVNPFDKTVREGGMKDMVPLNFPATLGGDVSGVVAELGEGVAGFSVGQAVYGQANAVGGEGSYAEFTPVKADSLAAKPDNLTYETAAAAPLTGVSALQALVDHAELRKGQKILIHGGAGGIGSFAVQLAKHLGAHVTATAGTEDIDYVKGLGAEEVIDYKTQDFTTHAKGYDVVFDTVGSDTLDKSYQVVKKGGVIVSMIGKPDEALAKKYGVKIIRQVTKLNPERLAKLTELLEKDVLTVNVDKVFPLERAGEAQAYIQSGKHHGKVVLRII